MTDALRVSESLRSLIYETPCSSLSAVDRAILIERELGDVFEVAAEFADTEEIEIASERVEQLSDGLTDLLTASDAALAKIASLPRVGEMIVASAFDAAIEEIKLALTAGRAALEND